MCVRTTLDGLNAEGKFRVSLHMSLSPAQNPAFLHFHLKIARKTKVCLDVSMFAFRPVYWKPVNSGVTSDVNDRISLDVFLKVKKL